MQPGAWVYIQLLAYAFAQAFAQRLHVWRHSHQHEARRLQICMLRLHALGRAQASNSNSITSIGTSSEQASNETWSDWCSSLVFHTDEHGELIA